MAERKTIIFGVELDSKDAIGNVKKLDKALNEFSDTVGIEVSGSISKMEDKLYELGLQGQQNTQEFKTLQEQVARYKQIVIETDRSIDALAEQGRGLSNALALAEGTVAGYQAFTGVSALLGTENEALLETMTKLQAAQGVLNSIMVIRQKLQEKSIVLSRLQAAAQALYTTVVGTTTGAMKLLRLAMLAVPLVALVAGIVAVITYFDKLVALFRPLIDGFKALTDWFGWTDHAGEEAAKNEARRVNEAIADIKRKREALTEAYTAEQKAIDRQIKLRKLEGKSFDDLTTKKINGTIEYKKEMIVSMQEELKALQSLNLERQKSLILIAANKAQIESVNAQIQALNDEVLDSQIELKENEKAILDKRRDAWKKHRDEQLAKEKKYRDELLKIQQAAQARMDALLDEIAKVEEDFQTEARDKAVNAVTDKYFRLIEEAKQYGYDTSTLEQAQQAELTTLRDGFAKEDLERQRNAQNMIKDNRIALMKEGQEKESEAVRENYARQLIDIMENEQINADEKRELAKQLKELEEQELLEIAKTYAEEEKQLKIDKFNEYAQNVQDGISAISTLNEAIAQKQIADAEGNEKKQEKIARKAFNINKALQLASATVSGIQAVQNAYTTAQASPITLANPAYPFIAAGIAAATSAANIAKIATARFEGGGSVSAPAGGASQGASAAVFSIGANTNTEQTQLNPDGTQANGGGMVKVFVAESDITETQNNVQQINTLSTF